MWKAKMSDFDLGGAFDIQFLVGAGVQTTIEYLEKRGDSDSEKALNHIKSCQNAGYFGDMDSWRKFRKEYFGIN